MPTFDPAPQKIDGALTMDDGTTYSHFHTHKDGSWGFDIYPPEGGHKSVTYLDAETNQVTQDNWSYGEPW